jgi:hypothetical protein
LIVSNGETKYTDDIRSSLASTASVGQQSITLSNATDFQIGYEVLIIQIQGAGAGAYEFAAITNKTGNTLTLSKALGNTYTTGGNSKAQVIRVPHYQDVTVQSGGILTAQVWDGNTGGILIFRVQGTVDLQGGGIITMSTKGYRGGSSSGSSQWSQPGESEQGFCGNSQSNCSSGGGGGVREEPDHNAKNASGGGGGGNGTNGAQVNQAGFDNPARPPQGGGMGGATHGTPELSVLFFGGGGGEGGGQQGAGGGEQGGDGGKGGGGIFIAAQSMIVTGTIEANGGGGARTNWGSGGGGAGGSIFLMSRQATIGQNRVLAVGGPGGGQNLFGGSGGLGGNGRIRIEYESLSGTASPSASTQQVNFFNLTGSSFNNLYLPDSIASGSHIRYQLLYGQRGSNTNGGDQSYTVHLPNRGYSALTLSALVERVAGSGSTFNFCLDFGNDGTCDWNANNQNFSNALRLDSPDLKNALNAYVATQTNAPEILTIPIRVNISTPADIFLFNLSAMPGANADLVPTNLTITPPNGNPPSNIPEGSQVTLSATVTNSGTQKAENFTVAFYNGDPATNGVLIGSTFVQSLAAAATSAPQTVTWNTTGLLGNKAIYVKVDASGAIAESNEANNTASASVIVKKKADLVITNLTIPDTRQSETGNASVTLKMRARRMLPMRLLSSTMVHPKPEPYWALQRLM